MTDTKKSTAVKLEVTPGLFRGLASQNMLFHQCIGELVDNSIAGAKDNPFHIDITFTRHTPTFIDVWVADNSAGMDEKTLSHALQPGGIPDTGNRLNEHGFGLKNSLATLCRESEGEWDIWTRARGGKNVLHVKGPFAPEMFINQLDGFPEGNYHPSNISTLIRARVDIDFIGTVQRGRGRRVSRENLAGLRPWVAEHLGVHYRGYLEQDEHGIVAGQIYINIDGNNTRVKSIKVPMVGTEENSMQVELRGTPYTLIYTRGILNDTTDDDKKKYKFYYQRNMPTQGIDIRLGKRVIITHLFKEIWGKERDNHYNKFIGELIIPELPSGVLTTKNDKTDFNLSDQGWQTIFDMLQKFPPPQDADSNATEAELKDKFRKQLVAICEDTGGEVGEEISLWPTGTRLDLCHKLPNGDIIFYELKKGAAKPLDLYQLKMYWDGLVLGGYSPVRAILLAEKYTSRIEMMATLMNEKLRAPNKQSGDASHPYCFSLATLASKNLIDDKEQRSENFGLFAGQE